MDATSDHWQPLRHAAAVTLSVGVAGALLAAFIPEVAPTAAATGSALVWLFFAMLATSAAHRAGRRKLRVVFGTVAGLIGLAIVGSWSLAILSPREMPVDLTESEISSFRVSASGDLRCSDSLAFSLPWSPDFEEAKELQDQLNAQVAGTHMFVWAYQNMRTQDFLLIRVVQGVGRGEKFFRGFVRGIADAAQQQATFVIEQESVTWNKKLGDYRLRSKSAEGTAMDGRCLASAHSRYPPIVVCVQTIARASTDLERFRAGLKLQGCS